MSQGDSKRHAVVIPGGMYGPSTGLLYYAGEVADRRSAELELIWWSPPSDRTRAEMSTWVYDQVQPVVDQVSPSLLIGKSLGSLSAAVAADRGLPAVWLTPLLTEPTCVDALKRATAPFLLIGGTGDSLWDGAVARDLTPHVLEVDDADHGMMLPGPMSDSIAVLGQVVAAIEHFLDDVVWSAA